MMRGLLGFHLSFALLATVAAALSLASAASAASTVVRYDGPDGFGIASDVPELPTLLGGSLDLLPDEIREELLLDVAPDLSNVDTSLPATALESWTFTNASGVDLGNVLLIFGRPETNDDLAPPAVYDPAGVGLVVENDGLGTDWFLVEALDEELGLLRYPAISLGAVADGAVSPFSLSYVLDDPHIFLGPRGETLVAPKWQVLPVAAPIPEPSTGWLVALGLAGLALGRRRNA